MRVAADEVPKGVQTRAAKKNLTEAVEWFHEIVIVTNIENEELVLIFLSQTTDSRPDLFSFIFRSAFQIPKATGIPILLPYKIIRPVEESMSLELPLHLLWLLPYR